MKTEVNKSTSETKLNTPNAETATAIAGGDRIARDPNAKGFTNQDDLKTEIEKW